MFQDSSSLAERRSEESSRIEVHRPKSQIGHSQQFETAEQSSPIYRPNEGGCAPTQMRPEGRIHGDMTAPHPPDSSGQESLLCTHFCNERGASEARHEWLRIFWHAWVAAWQDLRLHWGLTAAGRVIIDWFHGAHRCSSRSCCRWSCASKWVPTSLIGCDERHAVDAAREKGSTRLRSG